MKIQNILRNIFSQHMSAKGLVTRIYTELLTAKEEKCPNFKTGKILRPLQKNIINLLLPIRKIPSAHGDLPLHLLGWLKVEQEHYVGQGLETSCVLAMMFGGKTV